MTENKLAGTLARLFFEDSMLTDIFERRYGKKPTVFCEYNPRKYPKESDAPFVYINVDTASDDLTESFSQIQLGLTVGIREKEEKTEEYGTRLYALEILGDRIFPRMTELLRSVPGICAERVEKDFIFDNFPLCMASMTVLIKQNAPIGARRY